MALGIVRAARSPSSGARSRVAPRGPPVLPARAAGPAAAQSNWTARHSFRSSSYQCGPAALATVLAASGVEVTADELVPEVYLPGRRGSLQPELVAATRNRDRVPYVLPPRRGVARGSRGWRAGAGAAEARRRAVARAGTTRSWSATTPRAICVLLRSGTERRKEMPARHTSSPPGIAADGGRWPRCSPASLPPAGGSRALHGRRLPDSRPSVVATTRRQPTQPRHDNGPTSRCRASRSPTSRMPAATWSRRSADYREAIRLDPGRCRGAQQPRRGAAPDGLPGRSAPRDRRGARPGGRRAAGRGGGGDGSRDCRPAPAADRDGCPAD